MHTVCRRLSSSYIYLIGVCGIWGYIVYTEIKVRTMHFIDLEVTTCGEL